MCTFVAVGHVSEAAGVEVLAPDHGHRDLGAVAGGDGRAQALVPVLVVAVAVAVVVVVVVAVAVAVVVIDNHACTRHWYIDAYVSLLEEKGR